MTQLGSRGDYLLRFHSSTGAIRADFPCTETMALSWSRQWSEISKASVSGSTFASFEHIKDVLPWADMCSIWRGPDFVWEGFVMKPRITRTQWVLDMFDPGVLCQRTRTPEDRKWVDTDPVNIAGDLLDAVMSFQNIQAITKTAVRIPSATSYTFAVSKDAKMVGQDIADLVKMGVGWTMVAGRPVVMPSLRATALMYPQFGLQDCDILAEIEVEIDGTGYFNDVRLKGANWAETVTVDDQTGLRLQRLVSIDKLTGVSNIQRAARQQAARSSILRRTVNVPSGAQLRPDVEIGINELQPGIIIPVHTDLLGGITDWQRLESLDVSVDSGSEQVAVTLSTAAVELQDTAD